MKAESPMAPAYAERLPPTDEKRQTLWQAYGCEWLSYATKRHLELLNAGEYVAATRYRHAHASDLISELEKGVRS